QVGRTSGDVAQIARRALGDLTQMSPDDRYAAVRAARGRHRDRDRAVRTALGVAQVHGDAGDAPFALFLVDRVPPAPDAGQVPTQLLKVGDGRTVDGRKAVRVQGVQLRLGKLRQQRLAAGGGVGG